MNKVLKIISIVVGAIVFCACLFVDVWYLTLKNSGTQRVVSLTYKVGMQQLKNEDGTPVEEETPDNTKYFMEINSYKNLFEIKFNYMLDESCTSFYSQGIQIYAKNGVFDFDFNYDYRNTVDYQFEGVYNKFHLRNVFLGGNWWERDVYWSYIISENITYKKVTYNNYASGDDYESTVNSLNPINNRTMFKLQLGNEIYGMKFKGPDGFRSDLYACAVSHWDGYQYFTDYFYRQFDIHYFVESVYHSIFKDGNQSLKYGSNQIFTFEFSDFFNYYKCTDESNAIYDFENPVNSSLVSSDIKSYYKVLVNIYENEATQSSDSLFGVVNGSAYYKKLDSKPNSSTDSSDSDNSSSSSGSSTDLYFVGRSVISVDIRDFELIDIGDNKRKLKLRSDFENYYGDSKSKLLLSVVINKDYFTALNYEFVGFDDSVKSWGFLNGKYYLASTVNGKYVTVGVNI